MTRQPDLFISETPPEDFEDRPARTYSADPNQVRAHLHRILGEVRAAEHMPWAPKTALHYRTIFPQMTNWLPDDEAAQLRIEFEAELERLEAS